MACPISGCNLRQKAGHFLCRAHWYETPTPLRNEVWRTWRAYKAAKEPEAKLAALKDYRGARDAVLEWWAS